MIELSTKRIVLEQIQEKEGLTFFTSFLSSPTLTKYLPNRSPYPADQIEKCLTNRLAHWKDHDFGTFLIKLKDSKEIIGYCGLEYVEKTEFIDIRYGIFEKVWGQGLVKEAAQKTIEHGFTDLNLQLIFGCAIHENIGSIKILEAIGMQHHQAIDYYNDKSLKYYSISKKQYKSTLTSPSRT